MQTKANAGLWAQVTSLVEAPPAPRRPTARAATVCAALVGLLACAPSPAAALTTLRAPLDAGAVAGGDVTAPVVGLLSLVAWPLAGWLLVATALAASSRLPGVGGRVGSAVLRRVAPATVRRCLELALGLTVATAVVAGPASASHTGAEAVPPPAAVSTPLLDWPTTQLPRPEVVPAQVRTAEPRLPEPVVVRPGDSLWALAARSLGEGAAPDQVAATWPAWWSANRDVIGDDPDLLRPGAVLTPPPAG